MTKPTTLLIASLSILSFSATGYAELNAQDVSKIQQAAKAGQKVDKSERYPSKLTQVVTVKVSDQLQYMIDLRAQLCFAGAGGDFASWALVSCKSVKLGYPLLSPLMSWDETASRAPTGTAASPVPSPSLKPSSVLPPVPAGGSLSPTPTPVEVPIK